MNTFNHIKVANFVCNYIKANYGISLNRTAFVLGNIQPDFGINVVAKPHYIENYIEFVKKEFNELSTADKSKEIDYHTSRRLGVVCHYCTDFFCFVHNKDFTGSSLTHVNYERKLNKYCKHHYGILKTIDFMPNDEVLINCNAVDEILRLHELFMQNSSSYEKDWLSSLRVCILSVLFVIFKQHLQINAS